MKDFAVTGAEIRVINLFEGTTTILTTDNYPTRDKFLDLKIL